jgi:hypothetical protein
LLLVSLIAFVSGCGKKTVAPAVVAVDASPQGPVEPNEIELSDPKVTFEAPKTVRFEVKYRFTKGRPNQYYSCDISFPGTPNHAVKRMDSWELKAEGVIEDGVELSKPPVKDFEIVVSEAPTPRERYKQISNVVQGPVR